VDTAIEIVSRSEGVQQTRDLALVQAELAVDALSKLPDSDAQRALTALAHKVATRRK
jgi:geranylgeranyl pyrophosphate synthase